MIKRQPGVLPNGSDGLAPDVAGKGIEMKIDNVGRLQNIQSTRTESKGANASEGSPFKDLLAQEMDVGAVGTLGMDPQAGIEPSKLDEVLLRSSLSDSTGSAKQARESLEAGIGEIEVFVQALGDEAISPKAVDRIVQDLPAKLESLQKSLPDLQADHPLRLIAEELSVLSYVESVKWRRGDYV